MKRFYSILSLLLLFLAGASNVAAQEFKKETLLKTTEEVAAQSRFVLYSPGTSGDHPSGYVCGTSYYKQSIDKSCLFALEAVEDETVDGYQVYLLKQVNSGLYFKDFELGEGWDSSDLPPFSNGDLTEMTDNKAQAMKLTVLRFDDVTGVAGAPQSRTSAVNAKQNLEEDGFVLTRAKVSKPCAQEEDGTQFPYTYLGGIQRPFYSRWTDTNVHQIYTVNELTGLEKIREYVLAYFPGGSPDVAYPTSPNDDPGYYPADLVNQAKALYDQAGAWIGQTVEYTLTDEEADEFCQQILNLVTLLQKSVIKVETGYYFIRDSYGSPRYWRTFTSNNKQALGYDTYTVPDSLDLESARHIWKVTKSSVKNASTGEDEDVYSFQNYFTNEFVNVAKVGDFFSMGESPENFTIYNNSETEGFTGAFLIYPYGKPGQKMNTLGSHNQSGGIGVWDSKTDIGNNFRFQTVSEETVASLEEAIRQVAINEKLQTILSAAKKLKRENDGSVGIACKVSQLSGNENDPGEGQLENLIDGDNMTYYHSSWRDAQKDGVQAYVQADLGIAVSKIELDYTRRWRRVNPVTDNPAAAVVTVTNTPDDEESWQNLGEINFEYLHKATYARQSTEGTDTLVAESQGVTPVDFGGNYRYIRLTVTSVVQRSGGNTSEADPFWHLSELYFKSDATPNYEMLSEELRTRFETSMAQAAAALEAGTATQATIDALTAAYNEVLANIPDPIRIATAVAEAKALRAKAQSGTEPGYFPNDAMSAYDTAIETASSSIKAGITLEEIESVLAALDAATAEFNAALILPEVGAYYRIRGASTKETTYNGHHWNSARAPLASMNNAAKNALKVTHLNGAHEEDENGKLKPIAELSDSIYLDDLRYYWLVEEAVDGKIALRNVATGMYLSDGQTEDLDGAAYQSVEKASVIYHLAAPGKFNLVSGVVDGKETYFNVNSAASVGSWNDVNDENGFWSFEKVDTEQDIQDPMYYLSLQPGRMHIVTLPVAILPPTSCPAYFLSGQTDDNKLVLTDVSATVDGYVPAGTPFIIEVPADVSYGTSNIDMAYLVDEGDGTILDGTLSYVFEPVKVAGLQGTICETAKAGVGCAVLNADGIQGIKSGNIEVGVNSGYFDGTQTLGVVAGEDDPTLDIPEDFVLNSINDAVVLKGENNNVYSVSGVLVRKNVKSDAALKGLPAGLYIVNGEKVMVK